MADQYWKQHQIETLLLLGLPYLSKVLKSTVPEETFELLKEHIIPSYGHAPPFLTEALEAESYGVYYGSAGRRRNLVFDGDEEGKADAGWVRARKDVEVEDMEGYFEERDDGVRSWGYVMWDKERLDGWGVLGQRKVETRERGRWVCRGVMRETGRVLPSWEYVSYGEEVPTGS
jgi:hypothetical protein